MVESSKNDITSFFTDSLEPTEDEIYMARNAISIIREKFPVLVDRFSENVPIEADHMGVFITTLGMFSCLAVGQRERMEQGAFNPIYTHKHVHGTLSYPSSSNYYDSPISVVDVNYRYTRGLYPFSHQKLVVYLRDNLEHPAHWEELEGEYSVGRGQLSWGPEGHTLRSSKNWHFSARNYGLYAVVFVGCIPFGPTYQVPKGFIVSI